MWYYISKNRQYVHVWDTLEDAISAREKGDSQIAYTENLIPHLKYLQNTTIINHTDIVIISN